MMRDKDRLTKIGLVLMVAGVINMLFAVVQETTEMVFLASTLQYVIGGGFAVLAGLLVQNSLYERFEYNRPEGVGMVALGLVLISGFVLSFQILV